MYWCTYPIFWFSIEMLNFQKPLGNKKETWVLGSRGCNLAWWARNDPLPVVPGVAPGSEVASGLLASSEACLKGLLGRWDPKSPSGGSHQNYNVRHVKTVAKSQTFPNLPVTPRRTSEARSFRFFSSHCGMKLTLIPGDKASMPSPKPLRCTKTSSPPSEGEMKPKPFWSFQFLSDRNDVWIKSLGSP